MSNNSYSADKNRILKHAKMLCIFGVPEIFDFCDIRTLSAPSGHAMFANANDGKHGTNVIIRQTLIIQKDLKTISKSSYYMAKLRKAVAYRRLERPYTRISKFREKSFIRTSPSKKIIRFNMGNPRKKFEYCLELVSKKDIQIRDIAIESARQTSNRVLEKKIGNANFYFHIRPYPHHILRENPLAAGAGADRFSTGMSHSFGKPIGSAVRVKRGQIVMNLKVDKINLEAAHEALKKAAKKMPCSFTIRMAKLK